MKNIIFIILILCFVCQGFVKGQSCIDIDVPFCPASGTNPLIYLPPTQFKAFNSCDTTIIQPQFGMVTIDPANANVAGTYFYNPNTNCSPVDTFTVLECCNIMGQTVCDTLEQYYLHLTFECETPDDLFCCIPNNGNPFVFEEEDLLENDLVFIEANYPGFVPSEVFINGLVSSPANGTLNSGPNGEIIYTVTSPGFMGVDSIVYDVMYYLENASETVTICDEQTAYLVVEDCLNTMPDGYCIAPDDTLCITPLANDTVEPNINDPALGELECQNQLPVINAASLMISPQASAPPLFNNNGCNTAFTSSATGTFTYLYNVCTNTGVCTTDTITVKVEDTLWNFCDPVIDLGMTELYTTTIHAQNQVITSGTVPEGTNVSLKAGQCIRLDAGFQSDANADLQIIIEDCTPQ